MRSLLHLLKYDGMEPVARRLGYLVAAQVAALPALPVAFAVIPVPLYAGKQRQRGYNQALLLARAVVEAGRERGLDWKLHAGLLRRKRPTESQAGLTPRQRRDNVRGAFFVPGGQGDPAYEMSNRISKALAKLRDRDVLLIDDIYTTGATARAVSRELRAAGAASVWVATVARAQKAENLEIPLLAMEQDVAFWG